MLCNTEDSTATFGKWRKRLWPVHATELRYFLPLFFMKFCVSFNYTILAATKDTVTVTTSGAEAIPVLKGGVVIIVAFLAMLVYSKLSNILSRTNLFYAVTIPFLFFFLLYGGFLYPYRELLIPTSSADWLLSLVGEGHKHWVSVYRYWMNSGFYVVSELWGGMMISLLFWGFANQITSVKDAARFYALYTAGGHLGTIAAGSIIYSFSQLLQNTAYESTVMVLMIIATIIGLVILGIYWWTNQHIVNQPGFIINLPSNQESRTKLSLVESILYIIRSPYLGLIALMVIGYGLSVNMVEVSWKAMLKIQFPDANDYQAYMGILQFCLGITSLFVAIFVGGNFLRKYGWYASAQLTPIVLGFTSLLFFGLYFLFPNYDINNELLLTLNLPLKLDTLAITPLVLLVFVGTVHNIACKAMKYCLFDPTKEMVYIPLDNEAKVKGKAAVDLVGARFGKSGASWTQLALIDLVGAGSILGVIPLLVPCVACVVAFWAIAVHNLNKKFVRIQKQSSLSNKALNEKELDEQDYSAAV